MICEARTEVNNAGARQEAVKDWQGLASGRAAKENAPSFPSYISMKIPELARTMFVLEHSRS